MKNFSDSRKGLSIEDEGNNEIVCKIRKYEIKKEEDFLAIEEIWRSIETGTEMTIFQSYDWNKLLIREELSKPLSGFLLGIYVYVGENERNAVVIFPIVVKKHSNKISKKGRRRGIYLLGSGSYSDYLNAIYKGTVEPDMFGSVLSQIRNDFIGYEIHMDDIRQDTQFLFYLINSTNTFTENVAVQVTKRDTLDEYNKELSKSVRQNLRTAKNRMNRDGVSYELTVLERTDDKSLIDKLRDIHIERVLEKNMQDRNGFFLRLELKYRIYKETHNNIISNSMKSMEESRIVIVKLNGNISGYLYGLVDKRAIRILQNCVRSEYKFYSPMFCGAFDYIVQTLYEKDEIDIVDFTRGDEKYKYNLGGEEVKLYSFML